MVVQDAAGRTYSPVRKFGDSRLPADDLEDGQHSLARLYSPDGKLLVPTLDGKFKIEGSDEVLIVLQR
jgi:hypothetical protein